MIDEIDKKMGRVPGQEEAPRGKPPLAVQPDATEIIRSVLNHIHS